MKRAKKIPLVIAYVAGVCCILPFLLISFHVWPSADDYSISVLIRELGHTSYFISMYNEWTGRYTTNLLESLHPMFISGLWLYRMIPLLVLLLLLGGFYAFTSSILRGSIRGFFPALILFLLYLNALPSPAESIYWFPGAVEYTLSLASLLFIFSVSVRVFRRKKICTWLWIFYYINIIFVCGLNEIALFICVLTTMAIAVFTYLRERRLIAAVVFPALVALISASVAVAAPGNFARMSVFPDAFNLPLSLYGSLTSVVKLTGSYLQSPPFLLISLLYLSLVMTGKLRLKLWNEERTGLFPLLTFVVVMFLIYLPSWLATGLPPAMRVHGFAGGIFIIGWFYVTGKLASRIKSGMRIHRTFTMLLLYFALISVFTDFHKIPGDRLVCRGKIITAWYELVGKAPAYDRQMSARENEIIQAASEGIPSMAVTTVCDPPAMLYFCDIKEDPRFWINRATARWYGIAFIQLSK